MMTQQAAPETAEQFSEPAALDGPILVVDDDSAIRCTVAEILNFEGYPVLTASNGAEALAVIESARPALVLLDMRMPVLDGWGFARAIRERGLRVPILVMTAAHSARQWAEEIKADGYLPKPFDLLDLLTNINRLRDRDPCGGPPGDIN